MIARPHPVSSGMQASLRIVPLGIIALATVVAHGTLAARHPLATLVLLLWIVADSLMLALVGKWAARPPVKAVLATLAGACLLTWAISPGVVRAALLHTPALAGVMIALVLAHIGWASIRAGRLLRQIEPGARRWMAVASEFVPPALARFAVAEWTVMHIALFRWNGRPDVPANARAFAYHRHLAPMCAALLVLSAIEVAVYHLLLARWSRTATIAMFIVSDLGFVYLIGLIKSFRLRPVLLLSGGLRIRAGLLIDQFVPLDAIAVVESDFTGDDVRDARTLNAALLAWPNVMLRLNQPLERASLLRRRRAFSRVALRLDDPEPFLRLVAWRIGQGPR